MMINHNKMLSLLCAVIASTTLSACQTTQSSNDVPLKSSDTYMALNERGVVNYSNGRYQQAVVAFQNSLKVNPENKEARFGLAESFYKLQDYNSALEAYQMLLSEPEYKSRALQGIGLSELQKGHIQEAIQSLELAVNEDESLWRSWNGLGQAYDYQKEWGKSENAYNQALVYAADNQHVIHNNKGVSYLAQKRQNDAVREFDLAAQYDANSDYVDTNYRLALAAQNRYDEAVLDSNVESEAKALNNVGYAAMLQGRYDDAERLFLRAIEVSPNFYKTPYHNLQVLHELRRN